MLETEVQNEDDEIPCLSDDDEKQSSPSPPPTPKASKVSFKHLISASDVSIASAKKSSKSTAASQVKSETKLYQCEACGFSTNLVNILASHKDYYCCRQPNKTKEEVRDRDELDFTCDHCEFTSQDSKDYSRHVRRHIENAINDKRYKCDRCDFSTFDKYSLIHHIEENRCSPSSGDLLHCDLCADFEAISPFDIIDHLKEFHVFRPASQQQSPDQVQRRPTTTKQKRRRTEKIPIIRLERIN